MSTPTRAQLRAQLLTDQDTTGPGSTALDAKLAAAELARRTRTTTR